MFKTDAREIIEDAISAAVRPGMTTEEAKAAMVETIGSLIEQPIAVKTEVVVDRGTARIPGAINVTISEIPYL